MMFQNLYGWDLKSQIAGPVKSHWAYKSSNSWSEEEGLALHWKWGRTGATVREKNEPPRRRRAVSELLHHRAKVDNPLRQLIRAFHYHHRCHHQGRPRRLQALSRGRGGGGRWLVAAAMRRRSREERKKGEEPVAGELAMKRNGLRDLFE